MSRTVCAAQICPSSNVQIPRFFSKAECGNPSSHQKPKANTNTKPDTCHCLCKKTYIPSCSQAGKTTKTNRLDGRGNEALQVSLPISVVDETSDAQYFMKMILQLL